MSNLDRVVGFDIAIQDGVAGGGAAAAPAAPPFFPTQSSKVLGWLRLAGATGNGASLSVPDVLLGGSATPFSSGSAPTLSTNANGLRQVTFDGVSDALRHVGLAGLDFSEGIGFATWIKLNSPAATCLYFDCGTSSVRLYGSVPSNCKWRCSGKFQGNTTIQEATFALPNDTWLFLYVGAAGGAARISVDAGALGFTEANIVGDPFFPDDPGDPESGRLVIACDINGFFHLPATLGPNAFILRGPLLETEEQENLRDFESMQDAA